MLRLRTGLTDSIAAESGPAGARCGGSKQPLLWTPLLPLRKLPAGHVDAQPKAGFHLVGLLPVTDSECVVYGASQGRGLHQWLALDVTRQTDLQRCAQVNGALDQPKARLHLTELLYGARGPW